MGSVEGGVVVGSEGGDCCGEVVVGEVDILVGEGGWIGVDGLMVGMKVVVLITAFFD